MAFAAANLTTSGSTTDATSFATASVAPTANALVLIGVTSNVASGTANAPTVTGAGVTFVQEDTVSLSTARLTVLRGLEAAPSSGALTIDFAGQTQTACCWSVIEITGTSTAGTSGSDAVRQSITNSGSSITSITATLAAFEDAAHATVGFFQHSTNENTVVGGGFTELGDVGVATPNTSIFSEWLNGTDTTVDASWATTTNARVIGLEIRDPSTFTPKILMVA